MVDSGNIVLAQVYQKELLLQTCYGDATLEILMFLYITFAKFLEAINLQSTKICRRTSTTIGLH